MPVSESDDDIRSFHRCDTKDYITGYEEEEG